MRRGRPRHDDLLTPREWEVLHLLSEGLTNEQIAKQLGISEGGAKFHVSEILGKLGLSSRKEAADWRQRNLRQSGIAAVFGWTGGKAGLQFAAKLVAVPAAALLAGGLLWVAVEFSGISWASLLANSHITRNASTIERPLRSAERLSRPYLATPTPATSPMAYSQTSDRPAGATSEPPSTSASPQSTAQASASALGSDDTPSDATAIAIGGATAESIGTGGGPLASVDGIGAILSLSCHSTGEVRISYRVTAPAGDRLTRVILLDNGDIADDSGAISEDAVTRETTLSIGPGTTHRFQISYELASDSQVVPNSQVTCSVGH